MQQPSGRKSTRQKPTLATKVTEYAALFGPRLKARLNFYAAQPSLAAAISVAAMAMTEDGTINPHQRRVGKKILSRAAGALIERENEIKKCRSFDELIDFIEKATEGIDRFGELAVYDTSLRIAAKVGCWPTRVYLHVGTRQGARRLDLDTSRGFLERRDLPEALRPLKPHEAEDFLCIYKNAFGPTTVGEDAQACGGPLKRRPRGC